MGTLDYRESAAFRAVVLRLRAELERGA